MKFRLPTNKKFEKSIEQICSALDSGWVLHIRRHQGVWEYGWDDPAGVERGWLDAYNEHEIGQGKWHSVGYEWVDKRELVNKMAISVSNLIAHDKRIKERESKDIKRFAISRSEDFRKWAREA